jgi:hypothetical protein
MTPLARDFAAEFGPLDDHTWSEILAAFGDANLYQTWSYNKIRHRRLPGAFMVLRRQGHPVAAAHARVLRLPAVAAGVAYVRWGPMWRRRGAPRDVEVFRQAARALRNEFSHGRGLLLRLYPWAHRGADDPVQTILQEEGYGPASAAGRERTLILDLQTSLEDLRAALDQKWRNCLNKAEKSGLELLHTDDESLFDELSSMHSEMLARKGPVDRNDLADLKALQRSLPAASKLRVIACRHRGQPCAGAVFAPFGDTGLYVRGATSDAGLKSNGSYLVQWTFIRWLREQGFQHYDLNGINRTVNPGTYHFKRGLAGRGGREVEFLGRFQVADSARSRWLVTAAERAVAAYSRLVGAARSLAGPRAPLTSEPRPAGTSA